MCYRWDDDNLVIDCIVQPKSKENTIEGVLGDRLKIKIAAPPADGKANKELLKFLASRFGVSQSAVNIEAGLSSRRKRVRIERPSRLIEGIGRA